MRLLPLLNALDDTGLTRSLAGSACLHTPPCPTAKAADREAAIVVASHPEQGWSLLCNGVLVFDDTGDLLPNGQTVAPHRPAVSGEYFIRYRHPHVVASEPRPFDMLTVQVREFTGLEEQPELPVDAWRDPLVTREQRRRLQTEYEAARISWSKARLRQQAAPLLRQADALWQVWTAAETELTRVFTAFWETADGHWRAQLLRLADTESAARHAADAFDTVAAGLVALADDQIRIAGEDEDLPLRTVAQEIGLDASDWPLAWHGAYRGGAPTAYGDRLADHLHQQITQQRERLREVDGFVAGLRFDGARLAAS